MGNHRCNCNRERNHEYNHGHRHEHNHKSRSEKDVSGRTGGVIEFLRTYGTILFSALLLFSGIILSAFSFSAFSSETFLFCWYLIAGLPVGLPVMKEAWDSIRAGEIFSEFTLMSVATIGAFCIGEYPEGVAVMLFYSLGELFQNKAVDKATRNIRALLDVRPETARVLRGQESVTLPAREVQVGEVMEVKPGERVPLDAFMLSEVAAFNTAALTGESMPRYIPQKEEVLAGMIVIDKVVRLEVTKPFEKSTLSRILELVQHASERKAPAEQFIHKFARIYTPLVTGLALLIVLLPYLYSLWNGQFLYQFDEWLYRALVFLVISCPCALVVSIPLGYFGGIGAASRLGILFKGGNYLDAITKINTVVFDKTGTLTTGTFSVQSCYVEKGGSERESLQSEELFLQRVASAEQNSTHPLAKAIVAYALQRGVQLIPATNTTELSGYGLETWIDGSQILVGNLRLLDKFGVKYPSNVWEKGSDTMVVCAVDKQFAGYLLLSDVLKPDAVQAVQELKGLNIENIQILSGDKQAIVTTFAEKLAVSEAYGDLLPEGKVEHIEKLCGRGGFKVAFVGDGINDAPVLARSHVGIAMGGLGSDAAIETADVVIQTDQPSKVATAIHVGKQTRRVIRQNILLAFGVKLFVLILGAGGVATLWEAVFADVGVALLAIMNAVRIQKMVK